MPTVLETEMRIGAMIRTMSGDVRDSFRQQVYELYDADEEAKTKTYKEACARWHWNLIVYCDDVDIVNKYIAFIQIAYRKKMDLDNSEIWKQLMRIVLPSQFIKKIEGLTQVPRLAIMDKTPLRKGEKRQERAIFSME